MSSGNTDFSTLTKGKNFKMTGLHFRGCGKGTIPAQLKCSTHWTPDITDITPL